MKHMKSASRFSGIVVLLLTVAALPEAWAWQDAGTQEGTYRDPATTAQVSVEDSVTAGKHADEALRLRRDNRLADAVAVYQEVLDDYRGKLLHDYGNRYVGVRAWVERELRSDPALLEMYRNMTEPTAQRALGEARKSQDPIPAIQEVVDRYGLTDAGLDAAFELAGLFLERGTPLDAADVLEDVADHPDFGKQMGRWHYLSGVAAVYGHNQQRASSHSKALVSLQMDESARSIAALTRMLDVSMITQFAGDGGVLDIVEVPDTLDPPLWRLPLMPSSSAGAKSNEKQLREQMIRQQMFLGRANGFLAASENPYMTIPAMDDRLLYLNNNVALKAVDRISQDEVWSFAVASEAVLQNVGSRYGSLDTRGVALHGDNVYAVLGMTMIVSRWNGARDSGATELLCINRKDGKPVWRVSAGDLHEDLNGANFLGTPMVGPDRLYCLLRRNASGHYETFLVGVDARNGDMLWKRYVSGAPPMERNDAFPPAQAVTHDDQIYVVDNIGAVASIDGRTGRVRWLNILANDAVKTKQKILESRRNADVMFEYPPAVIPAGLVANPYRYSTPVLIDIETGRTIREFKAAETPDDLPEPAEGIDQEDEEVKRLVREASIFQRWGDDLLAVGKTVAVLDGQTLELKWKQDLNTSKNDLTRPALTKEAMWIASGQKVHVFDRQNGKTLLVGDIETHGNLLVRGDHLVVAGQEEVHSHMAWPSAKKALLEQVKNSPKDPSRGLALARLAHAVKRHEAVIEGVDYAIVSLDQGGAVAEDKRQAVFNNVRSWVGGGVTKDLDARAQLFERLAQVASTPGQQATYLIELGAFQEESGQHRKAVRQYQTILDKPTLSAQFFEEGTVKRQAGVEARQNLERMVTANPSLYAQFDADATLALNDLKSKVTTDADSYIALASRYPFAKAAPLAYIAAADVKMNAGDSTFSDELKQAYQQTRVDSQLAGNIISRLVTHFENAERRHLARYWLSRVQKDHPDVVLVRGDVSISPDDWRGQLFNGVEEVLGLPKFSLSFGQAYAVDGRLLTPIAQPRERWPRDAMITATRDELHFHQGLSLDLQWSTKLLDRTVMVLSCTNEQVLVWYPQEGLVQAIDTADGRETFPTINLGEALAEIDQQGGRRNPIVDRTVRSGLARNARLRTTQSMIYVAEQTGGVVAIDRVTGQVLWSRQFDVAQLDQVEVNDEFLVVGGLVEGKGGNAEGRLFILDAETGDGRAQSVHVQQGAPTWVGIGGANLFVAVADQLIAYDGGGEIVWTMDLAQGYVHGDSHVRADMLAVVDATESFLPIDPASGKLMHNERLSVTGDTARGAPIGVNVIADEKTYFVMSSNQLMRISGEGKVLWRDSVDRGEPKDFRALFVSDTHEFVIAENPDRERERLLQNRFNRNADINASAHLYQIYVFDREGRLVEPARAVGPLPEQLVSRSLTGPDRQRERIEARPTLTLEQNLVIGTLSKTVVIPSASVADN